MAEPKLGTIPEQLWQPSAVVYRAGHGVREWMVGQQSRVDLHPVIPRDCVVRPGGGANRAMRGEN